MSRAEWKYVDYSLSYHATDHIPEPKPLSRWDRLLIFLRLKRKPLTPKEITELMRKKQEEVIDGMYRELFQWMDKG